jgi:gentisate 1,2-dioxygenase
MTNSYIHEYSSCAVPDMTEIPPAVFPSSVIKDRDNSNIYPLDTSSSLKTSYTATSPNLLANFVVIVPGQPLEVVANCTSHLFYVIRGHGLYDNTRSMGEWNQGDLFVVTGVEPIKFTSKEYSVLYWINDSPLLEYLGVSFHKEKFQPTFFKKELLYQHLDEIRHDENNHSQNRLGILLSNPSTEFSTKTITHVLWSLLNVLPKRSKQRPHKHNSVALDLCVSGGSPLVYTLMGPELDEQGWVKDPLRIDWQNEGVFVTPPGWYHSHHNDSDEDAIVLPIQDAGLYTYQRTLDIQFSL